MKQDDVTIHPTAIIHAGAELGKGVKVGPYCVIGPKVRIDDNTILDANVIIGGRTFIGANSRVWPFATLGSDPQDLKFRGEDTELVCGVGNRFREYCNISLGTASGRGRTVIGSNNFFMVNTHVAHDCVIGNDCVIANGVSLAGHIEIGDHTIIGGHAALHQFIKIGAHSMIGGGSIVVQDVLPFMTAVGNHASMTGVNVLGMQRRGFSREEVRHAKNSFRVILRSNQTLDDALQNLQQSEPSRVTELIVTFLKNRSARGLCR